VYVCEGETLAQYGSGGAEKPAVDTDGTYLSFLETGKALPCFAGFAVFSYPKFSAAHTAIAQHRRFSPRRCKTHKHRCTTDTRSAVPSLPPSPKRALLARTTVPLSPISQTLEPQNQKSPLNPSKQHFFP